MKLKHLNLICCTIVMCNLLLNACTYLCEAPVDEVACRDQDYLRKPFLVTDFSDENWVCLAMDAWQNSHSLQLHISCEDVSVNVFGRLSIVGNDGQHESGWTGGGIKLPLTQCSQGMDISAFQTLKVDFRFPTGSYLHFSKLKLEDTDGQSTLELPLQAHGVPDTEWKTFTFPVKDFVRGGGAKINFRRVKSVLTVADHNGTYPYNIDGVMEFDNVRLE